MGALPERMWMLGVHSVNLCKLPTALLDRHSFGTNLRDSRWRNFELIGQRRSSNTLLPKHRECTIPIRSLSDHRIHLHALDEHEHQSKLRRKAATCV